MRKDLVRLRMEMHRQQVLYHAQPLAHPIQRIKGIKGIKGMVANRGMHSEHHHVRKGPLMVATTLALALFGRRLGKVGKLARLGIMLYPVVQKMRH